MYKIRLYVVPEVQEDEQQQQQQKQQKCVIKSDDVVIDDIDSPMELPPIMQRRNSRRPSSNFIANNNINKNNNGIINGVHQNFIQKECKNNLLLSSSSYSVTPKFKQMKQYQISNNNNNNNNTMIDNINNQKKIQFSTTLNGNNNIKIKRSVFASQKIQELAANLEEKMMEQQQQQQQQRNTKVIISNDINNIYHFNNNVNSELLVVVPRKIIRNENNSSSSSSSNLFSSGNFQQEKRINDTSCVKINSMSDLKSDKNSLITSTLLPSPSSSSSSSSSGIHNSGITSNTNTNTSVILRKNNKLNRYREYDLEQKIEVEIKMREGSARLLAAARHRAQSLEAARALLTSNERMSAYMAELQRRKKEPSSNKPSLPVSNARVALSDLRVPLMWRDSDHFKNRGDYRRFAVFCLARVGTEIHDTALLCPVDRALTDVTFPDVLVFNNVPAEFEVTLEIYSHILQEDLSIASTPRRIKRSIHSSISRTVGKKLAASLRDELNSGKIGPHFELMASARLTLDDTDDNIHTHDLVLNNLENKNHSLPLFGHFCCRLAAQPECITKEACSGNVILDGRSCWAKIQGFKLQAWDSRKLADDDQSPWSTVPINKETLIQPSKSSSKELRISNTIEGSSKITTIRLETSEEAQKWVRQLVAHAKDHLRWRHAAENVQDVPSVESARNSFIGNKRQGSLYDETPLIESVQSDFNTAAQRPTVQQIFGLTPSTSLSSCSSTSSPPSLRSRSLSISGPRKSGTNTLRSHWPFSNKNHD